MIRRPARDRASLAVNEFRGCLPARRQFGNRRRRKRSPSVASASCVGAKERQIAAARAIDFTLLVNDSITIGPLKPMSRHAFGDLLPRHVARARRAAIVFAGVQVAHSRAGGADGVANRPLLDVHVERVEQQAAGRMVDAVDDLDRLRRQVEEAGLEPVERLDAES